MNIAQRMTRWLSEQTPTAVLVRDGSAVTPLVSLADWTHDAAGSRSSVTFGPYERPVRASGVRITVDGATDEVMFGSELGLPTGQTYVYTLTVAVT